MTNLMTATILITPPKNAPHSVSVNILSILSVKMLITMRQKVVKFLWSKASKEKYC